MKKDFEEIYADLCSSSSNILKDAKEEKNKKIWFIVVICLAVNVIIAILDKEKIILAGTIALSALLLMLTMNKEFLKFRKIYKRFVVEELVKQYSEKLNYTPDVGVSKFDYSLSHFDNSFDEFCSEDRIFGTIGQNSNFQMSKIITKIVKKERDENGEVRTERVETFRGLYGIIKLEKNSNAKIYIANNSIIKKYSLKRVEMDSAEFEKQFDCLTEDKITAMKIFTPDLIEKFALLKKDNITNFEVKIEEDMLYFRYKCGEIFEPPKIKDILDKELIKKYYDSISFPIDLTQKIISNINEL